MKHILIAVFTITVIIRTENYSNDKLAKCLILSIYA